MQIVLDDGVELREVDVIVHDPDATVGDLVRALDPDGGHPALVVDGRALPAERRLDRAGIAQGSVARLVGADEAVVAAVGQDVPPTIGEAGLVSLQVSGGLAAGGRASLRAGRHPLGRDGDGLALTDATVSARHAVVDLTEDGRITITDAGSHNGTWLDGVQVVVPTALPPGGVLRLGASQLTATLPAEDLPTGARARPSATGTVPFNRPPRPVRPQPPDLLEPPVAPEPRTAPHPVGVVAVIAPVVMGLVMVVAFDSLLFGLFALLSPVVLLGTTLEGRRRGRVGSRRDRARYDQELSTLRATLARLASEERARLVEELPDPAEVVRRASGPSTRLWERRLHHDDALRLRAGTGAVAWDPPLAGNRRTWSPEVRAIQVEIGRLVEAPAAVDLSAGGVVGVVGDRTAAPAVARSLVVQAATHHGPADLTIAVLSAADQAGRWDWAKWLPHTVAPGGSGPRLLSADRDAAEGLLRGLLDREVEAARSGPDRPQTGPVTLLVLDDESLTEGRRSPTRAALRADGVVGIVVAETEDRLPAICRTVIELIDEDGRARVHHLDRGERLDEVLATGVTEETARHVARALARFEDPELEVPGAGLPAAVALLPLLGLDPPDPTDLLARWTGAGADPDLLVPIGVAADGPLAVDLVRDGPHALVAGTTGSGKSELLRSLVAGLAAACSPDHLSFVLIDFKGGSAFDRCAQLPHTVGLVTDLDAHLAARALRCLEAELRHRERTLRAAGAADLTEYRRRPGARAPVPRLVVVVDEFATLKAELPEFVDALVGVAQRGRSLGVHLVLATQRPSGAVSDHIRANTNLRIALRVQDPADSEDVIDRPDAARIGRNQPGRALVRLGPGELVTLQAALSTGIAVDGGHGPVEVRPFRFGSQPASSIGGDDGQGPPAGLGDGPVVTDLDRLVDAAVEAHRRSGRPRPRRPWPDPLPRSVALEELTPTAGDGLPSRFAAPGEVVTFALADDPDHQTQRPTGWVPADGNLLLVGIPGSGTTTASASVVLAATTRSAPDDLHVHVLDLGAGDLAPLSGLPHVGSVVAASEQERQERLVRWLRAELDRRRDGGAAARSDAPSVLVVLDGLSGFRATWDDSLSGVAEDLQRVFADGPDVGLHCVVTADRTGAVPSWMQGLVRQRWLFRTGDPLELSALGLRAGDVPDLPPGGAVVVETRHEVRVARPSDGLASAVARIAREAASAVRRPPVRIGVLPTEVDARALAGGARLDGDPWVLPVGISGRTLEPASFVLHEGEHVLIAGPARSGRSTALAALAEVVRGARPDARVLAVAPRRSSLAGAISPEAMPGALAEASEHVGPVLVLVDDADLVDDDAGALAALLERARPGLHVAAAGRNDALRSAYGHWTRLIRPSRAALLLQPDVDLDGDLAGATLPRRSTVALTPGRGHLVCDGRIDVVQVGSSLHGTT